MLQLLFLRILLLSVILIILPSYLKGAEGQFVGSAKCGECHEKEYNKFITYSKKSKSWHSIEIMASDLTPDEIEECYDCHTTGHGQPGGFVSIQATPHLADVGCETCHGPGKAHVEADGDPSLIKRKPTESECVKCHNSERIQTFHFRPLMHAGAH
jgi:hypothetical protein